MEIVRNRIRLEIMKKDDYEKKIKNNHKETSMEIINILEVLMFIHSSETKFSRIGQYI